VFPNNLLSVADFSRKQAEDLFDLADHFEKHPPMGLLDRDQIVGTLFYEASTRTRLSFEAAALKMGGGVISVPDANDSSAKKGETVADAVRVMSGYCDLIVVRHPIVGSAAEAARTSLVPIVNAGDGDREHPSQALLDLYTIRKERGEIEGAQVALVGDLRFGRTVHSLALALALWPGIKIYLVAPAILATPTAVLEALQAAGVEYRQTECLEEILPDIDVLYATRIQKERFKGEEEPLYETVKDFLRITGQTLKAMKKDALVMHPLPRVGEIALEVDDDPRAIYFRQAWNGVPLRQGIIATMLNRTS